MFNLPGKKKQGSKSSQVGDISAAPQESVEGAAGQSEAAGRAGQSEADGRAGQSEADGRAGQAEAAEASAAERAESPNPNQELIERWDHRADLAYQAV